MTRTRLALLATLLPGTAAAQIVPTPYVSVGVGAAGFSDSLRSASGSLKFDTHIGAAADVAVGWRIGAGFRAEIDGSLQSNDVPSFSSRRVDGRLEPLSDTGGQVATYAVMPTLAYDLPVSRWLGPVRPYVGVGAGYGWLSFGGTHGTTLTVFHLPGDNTFTEQGLIKPGSGSAFAYQAFAGASVPLRVRGLELTGEYRYLGLARAGVPVSRVGLGDDLVNGVVPAGSTRNGFVVHDNAVLLGLRYRFGAR